MVKARRGHMPSLKLKISPNMIWPDAFIAVLLVGYSAWPKNSKNIHLATSSVRACFTPGANCESEILSLISQAKSEILVQAYAFTSENIGNALLAAHRRGVQTRIIYDKKAAKERYSQIPRLNSLGIKTIPDNIRGISHNKIIVLDRTVVVTGSYNFSNGARDKNAENVDMLSNAELANEFVENWTVRSKTH